jgi:hypothetical protein
MSDAIITVERTAMDTEKTETLERDDVRLIRLGIPKSGRL